MGKRYVSCPFCWGKIKDSAIKCMYCKKWLNTEENPNYKVQEKVESEAVESCNKIEIKINKTDSEVKYVDDNSILWWVLWFQIVCIVWAIVSYM